jgi:hypothetical protein
MSSCCTRERKKKDYLFMPMAVGIAFVGLGVLLAIEISIAHALGLI